jgi:hypothetical protein
MNGKLCEDTTLMYTANVSKSGKDKKTIPI